MNALLVLAVVIIVILGAIFAGLTIWTRRHPLEAFVKLILLEATA